MVLVFNPIKDLSSLSKSELGSDWVVMRQETARAAESPRHIIRTAAAAAQCQQQLLHPVRPLGVQCTAERGPFRENVAPEEHPDNQRPHKVPCLSAQPAHTQDRSAHVPDAQTKISTTSLTASACATGTGGHRR
mmetsp:Transcript_70480/g.117714  ORF Transcript_70480/g.117714 Transcript_70480/m.117714 type:complete len:134 (+) Transcript_70480:341-742(+)